MVRACVRACVYVWPHTHTHTHKHTHTHTNTNTHTLTAQVTLYNFGLLMEASEPVDVAAAEAFYRRALAIDPKCAIYTIALAIDPKCAIYHRPRHRPKVRDISANTIARAISRYWGGRERKREGGRKRERE